jgi:glycosyltransferase involved in cell wall biosynthesis
LNGLTAPDAIISSLPAPLVSVGIPTYNRAAGLRKTLECITGQSYRNLEIIVSDNCSPNLETENIVKEFMRDDPRIQYFRQEKNLGAIGNFAFVLKKATGDYFMWASDDDEWDREFIESCVFLLDQNKAIGMAFCNMVNIDSFGRIIREYPSFEVFSGPASRETITRFLKTPEYLGRPNLIYSMYRLSLCRDTWKAHQLTSEWGSDMCFVLGAIARGGIAIDKRVLFYKRIARDTDSPKRVDKIITQNSYYYTYDFRHAYTFIKNNLKSVRGTPFYWLTLKILLLRLPKSFLLFCLTPFQYLFKKNVANMQYKRE